MTKEETLQVINEIIDESAAKMKENSTKLLDKRDWDFDKFGDRNTFARAVMECMFENEHFQYQPSDPTRTYKELKKQLKYEMLFIH